MPKNADEPKSKSKMRLKSTRKPFRDTSNARTAIKSATIHKKISEDDGGRQAGDDSLDRLLLVHSDLSSLLRQIDELVVQALQMTNNDRRKIKQFADVLSDMQTSLKPWVSRFQKAVLSQSTGPENNLEKTVEKKALSVSKESSNTAIESPEETKWESLVSPSPLVSWRAGCNTESGRQLFLLTPMPHKKALSSKYQSSTMRAVEQIPSVSLSDAVTNLGNDLHEGVLAKPTPKMAFEINVTKPAVNNLQTICASPERVSNTTSSRFIMTPCMKMSPPKSCILLEPISAFSRKKSQVVHKSTPFPTGFHSFSESPESESSNNQSSDDLKLKYPELYGIRKENMQQKIAAEDSPKWIISSPPKTCVIMDPSNEPSLNKPSDRCLLLETTAVSNQERHFPAIQTKESDGGHATTSKSQLQDIIRTLDLAECTPMVKEPMSNMRMGKHPGENTLKKELWTRFEAATTNHGFCFKKSLKQDNTKKGFLDILDEASDA